MPDYSQVNYDETTSMAKAFHGEGEDITQLYSATRQRVQALRKDWVGEAAEFFFEEMETELLPALQRLAGAVFFAEEILNKIVKLIHEADEETATYFTTGLDVNNLGMFAAAGVAGGLAGSVMNASDFGAQKFEEALSSEGENQPVSGEPGSESADASQPGNEPGAASGASETPPPSQPEQEAASEETVETETPTAETGSAGGGGGGGGGGGEGSQGMQGDLKGLGTGLGGQAEQAGPAGGSAGGGAQSMPDHVYGAPAGDSSGASAPSAPAGGAAAPQGQSSGGTGSVAGAAGVVGGAAAVGGAAKVLKGKKNKEGR
jgi:WXG100 family type VII secretion target